MKIYSNKEFSQLPKFLRNEQVVPDSFRKFVRKFWETSRLKQCSERSELSKEEEQLASWKAYARKGQESCNYSYRLSKAEQLRSGLHQPVIVVCLLNPAHNQT